MPSRERSRRILHLIDTIGPGGAETVYLELVRGLAEYGWDSLPVVPGKGWLDDTLRSDGLEPECFDAAGRFDLGYAQRLRSLIQREHIDLVQTHLLGTSVYGTLACLGTSVPVVSTLHGQPDISPTDRLRAIKVRLLARPANRVVCVSESLRTHFERHQPFRRVHVRGLAGRQLLRQDGRRRRHSELR